MQLRHFLPSDSNVPAPTEMSTTEEQTSTMRSSEMDEESPVDLSLLRELGKNSLVNVLNSVRLLILDAFGI